MEKAEKVYLAIVICTRNRAGELVNCLPPVAKQVNDRKDVEVIIVDNGSSDNTKQVVQEFNRQNGDMFRYVFEGTPGLCQARNRGRAETLAEVLAYIDDDALVAPGWVEGILKHFNSGKSDCLGGRVSIQLEGEMPFPLKKNMEWFFMASTLGEEPKMLSHPKHPTGCNMAFRAEVFDEVGGFDTNLKLYGDETDFFARVYEKGFSIYYDPAVEVMQVIPADRLTKTALKEKSIQWGQGAAVNWLLRNTDPSVRRRQRFEFTARTAYMAFRSLWSKNFGSFFTYWYNRGYLSQLKKGLER